MKVNRKWIAALVIGAMVFGAGCSSSTEETSTESAAQTQEETTEEAAEEEVQEEVAENDTTSEEVAAENVTLEEGMLIMSTNATFPPYEYYDGDTIVGIDADVAAAIADKMGLTLQINDMEFDSALAAVQTGQADMVMAGVTVTPEREENMDFTNSYATGVQVVIVPEDSDITSIDDLQGKLIGVQQGTTGDIYCSDTPENGGYGEENVQKFSSGPLAVEALKNGQVDCVVIDNEPAKAYVEANPGLKILDTEFAVEDYAIGVAKGNDALLDALNNALEELESDGTLDKIIGEYIHE